ncbi:ATP-binding protein [Pseudoduganella sp. RAF19]|uniref:ATP-binding protein n=1 Tax=Pseudoduganella sp. RAF19 TaxID=3233052 RepID=UPI003F9D6A17
MRIITRLKLAQLLCIIVAAAVGIVLLVTTAQMRHELARNEKAGEILRGVVSLRYLAMEYAIGHEKRTRSQWVLRKESLAALLARDEDFRDGPEAEIYRGLREQLPNLHKYFNDSLQIQEELHGSPEKEDVLKRLEGRLFGLIMNKAQAMISDAEDLAARSREGALAAQRRANYAAGAMGVILTLAVLGALYMTIRSVARPLERLRHGTELVGAGKLDFALGVETVDEVGELARAFDSMTEKLRQTTVSRDELGQANKALHAEMSVRRDTEQKVHLQLARMSLLHQITRSIGDRQDLRSIFQVVVRSLEDQLPVDFGCVCLYRDDELIVSSVGLASELLSSELSMREHAHVPIDENGLSRCVRGQLVYEPDITELPFPFPKRLARGGLAALVLAPLLAESTVFGVLIVARRAPNSFSSGECEFLRQLSEHVALAANQTRLYADLQRAYNELHETQQSVTKQERLRALGQMASGIAHDINNAISPVALYTESLLETEPGLSESGRNCLQVIARAIDDVAATVARMRELYRQREPELALGAVGLNTLIPQVVDLTRARWSDMPQQRGVVIAMKQELTAALPPLLGAEGEIREALTNLIFNGVDAMPEGGTLTVRTLHKDGYVVLEVADTGFGMDEVTLKRCLDPFFTTKGERGTGLGLATVYSMVERHSAQIAIESQPGQGTTVRISFPVAESPDKEAQPPVAATPLVRMRLLIVDDDPTVLASLRAILLRDGHEVTAADGGQAGIDAFRASLEGAPQFNAIFTDLGMPYVDGRRVAETIKSLAPSMPVILLTGWGQRLIPDSGELPVNVDYVLSKPPRLRELREVLSRVAQSITLEASQ